MRKLISICALGLWVFGSLNLFAQERTPRETTATEFVNGTKGPQAFLTPRSLAGMGINNTNAINFVNYLNGGTNATLYRRAHLHYTNASSALVFWNGSAVIESGSPTITNAAHANLTSDFAAQNVFIAANWFNDFTLGNWEDTGGPFPTMNAYWWSPSNTISAGRLFAEMWSPHVPANFGTNTASVIDGGGFAPDGNAIKVSIPQNSDSYKIGVAVINPFPKLAEMYIENQSAGVRLGNLVWGVNWTGEAFMGSPGILRFIDPITAEPHDNLLMLNRTNLQTTIYGSLQLTNKTGNLKTTISMGTGSPEAVVTATVGSLYLRTDGANTTSLYVKTNGTGNTGWGGK